MALCLIDICLTVPLATMFLCVAARHVHPWSWESTHTHFSWVGQYPFIVWNQWGNWTKFNIAMSQWTPVLCGFVFWGFFGFTDEAMRHYRLAYHAIVGWVGFSRCTTVSSRVESHGCVEFTFSNATLLIVLIVAEKSLTGWLGRAVHFPLLAQIPRRS
jgi:pheromone a factor receptor